MTGSTTIFKTVSALATDAQAYREALIPFKNLQLMKCIIELDCLPLIQAIKAKVPVAEADAIIRDILQLLDEALDVGATWTPRDGNNLAHLLETMAVENEIQRQWIVNPLIQIMKTIKTEAGEAETGDRDKARVETQDYPSAAQGSIIVNSEEPKKEERRGYGGGHRELQRMPKTNREDWGCHNSRAGSSSLHRLMQSNNNTTTYKWATGRIQFEESQGASILCPQDEDPNFKLHKNRKGSVTIYTRSFTLHTRASSSPALLLFWSHELPLPWPPFASHDFSVIPCVARAPSAAALVASAPLVAVVAELPLPLSSRLLPSLPSSQSSLRHRSYRVCYLSEFQRRKRFQIDNNIEMPELCPEWLALLIIEKACLSSIPLYGIVDAPPNHVTPNVATSFIETLEANELLKPGLADGDCEAIDQDILQLQKELHQQVTEKGKGLMKLIPAVEEGREIEQRALEQVAMEKLVELAYKKKLLNSFIAI
ncbi:hypothetical protein Ahy_B05g076992 [Arachis hypogaea]|uniref:RNase H type-1 domain-containing protein n=1 Tax=Arachis hypogaea TaxID=3818 RepID=A0A444Z491_ARAHY|nr:hypothetical protein Ahy_B05g076992 [Arachis hypogaea]